MTKNNISIKEIFVTKKFLNRIEFFIGLSFIIIIGNIFIKIFGFIIEFLDLDMINQLTLIFVSIISVIIYGYFYYLLLKISNKKINSYSKEGSIISGVIIFKYIIIVVINILFTQLWLYMFYILPQGFYLIIEIFNFLFYISIIYLLFKKENPEVIKNIENNKKMKNMFYKNNGEYCDLGKNY